MNVLITGGAGFIGSHLADRYVQHGDRVTIVDDLSTGSIDNVRHLERHPRVACHFESVMNRPHMARLAGECDLIVHLAATVGVRLVARSSLRTIETNVNTTEVVLSCAAAARKRVVFASTSEVYGRRHDVPFRESDDLVIGRTDRNRWSYACSKALDEFLSFAYWQEMGVPVVIARLFNTVGPRQTGRYGMVVPTFVRQALAGEDLTVYGTGRQRRCFVHVADVVDAIAKLAEHRDSPGQVFNIGSTEEVTVLELAERAKALASSPSGIRLIPYEQVYGANFDDFERRVPDLAKISAFIGYAPARTLDMTLQDVIEWERSRSAAADHAAAAAGYGSWHACQRV